MSYEYLKTSLFSVLQERFYKGIFTEADFKKKIKDGSVFYHVSRGLGQLPEPSPVPNVLQKTIYHTDTSGKKLRYICSRHNMKVGSTGNVSDLFMYGGGCFMSHVEACNYSNKIKEALKFFDSEFKAEQQEYADSMQHLPLVS